MNQESGSGHNEGGTGDGEAGEGPDWQATWDGSHSRWKITKRGVPKRIATQGTGTLVSRHAGYSYMTVNTNRERSDAMCWDTKLFVFFHYKVCL